MICPSCGKDMTRFDATPFKSPYYKCLDMDCCHWDKYEVPLPTAVAEQRECCNTDNLVDAHYPDNGESDGESETNLNSAEGDSPESLSTSKLLHFLTVQEQVDRLDTALTEAIEIIREEFHHPCPVYAYVGCWRPAMNKDCDCDDEGFTCWYEYLCAQGVNDENL